MKLKDHKVLSKHILEMMTYPVDWKCKYAFLLGTVEPDCNPFTYLRGSIHEQTLRGHNFDNMSICIKSLIMRLQNSRISDVKRCFLLGKLIHYTADAFTFPHNKLFKGSLREHCSYEALFHTYFSKVLQSEKVMYILDSKKDLFSQIKELHEDYLKEKTNFLSDSCYILRATTGVFQYFTEHVECQCICFKRKERVEELL